ncbi:hypothetical protein MBLNU457_g1094t1 [Dothideomycetes sp. NU457]
MALEVLRTRPDISEFTPLATHQEATPSSFYSSKPVLHYTSSCTLQITQSALSHPAFAQLAPRTTPSHGPSNGTSQEQISLDVEAYITSSNLTLWSPSASSGIALPYPLISLHAQQGDSLYMQLILSDAKNTADEDLETLEMHLTPTPSTSDAVEESTSISGRAHTPAQQLYAAVSACADLHPDPSSDDDGDDANGNGVEGYETAAPGAGGWITAENMAQFMDEDGNFRLPEHVDGGGVADAGEIGEEGQEEELERGLGMGAGRVRRAEEFADAVDEGDEESKWRRTED